MLASSPMNPLAFKAPIPRVVLTDLQSSTSDLTTYTFSACQVDIHPTLSFADTTFGTNPYVTSPSRSFVAVAIHAEDAAATFSVNSVTLGGVSGTELYDRGGAGAGILVNTAFYVWATEALQGITNTDIAVTFSEAVTGCAIGVLSISNIGGFDATALGTDTTGSGQLSRVTAARGSSTGAKYLSFAFSTINANGEAFDFTLDAAVAATSNDWTRPILLYEGSNAEFGYAGAYSYELRSSAGQSQVHEWTVSWSGAANADLIAIATIII